MTGTSEEACHGLGEASVALLLADRGGELLLQRGVGHLGRNGQPSPAAARRFNVSRTVDDATPTRRAISLIATPAVFKRSTSRTWPGDPLHQIMREAAAQWHRLAYNLRRMRDADRNKLGSRCPAIGNQRLSGTDGSNLSLSVNRRRSHGGPRVRIHLPPALQQRVCCKPDFLEHGSSQTSSGRKHYTDNTSQGRRRGVLDGGEIAHRRWRGEALCDLARAAHRGSSP
jgi:hypothetical protein